MLKRKDYLFIIGLLGLAVLFLWWTTIPVAMYDQTFIVARTESRTNTLTNRTCDHKAYVIVDGAETMINPDIDIPTLKTGDIIRCRVYVTPLEKSISFLYVKTPRLPYVRRIAF